jgi:hypothetical protein
MTAMHDSRRITSSFRYKFVSRQAALRMPRSAVGHGFHGQLGSDRQPTGRSGVGVTYYALTGITGKDG